MRLPVMSPRRCHFLIVCVVTPRSAAISRKVSMPAARSRWRRPGIPRALHRAVSVGKGRRDLSPKDLERALPHMDHALKELHYPVA